jgi:hypothetical protein
MKMSPRLGILAASLVVIAVACWPVRAQEQKLPPEVNQAIDRGVEFLTKLQREDGSWPYELKGVTPLAAWTLLECGVSPNDPRITKAADNTRSWILTSNRTYEIALAILFFDKLGDPEDEPLIEVLALQLLAGQGPLHGWSYMCPQIADRDMKRLQEHFAKVKSAGPRKLPEKSSPAQRDSSLVHKDVMNDAEAINRTKIDNKNATEGADNSNTQFAMLALWVARRHGMPVDRALQRVEIRFRGSQQAKSGGWGYTSPPNSGPAPLMPNPPTAAMTCCGLIGLALGNGVTPAKSKIDLNKDPAVKAALYVVSANLGDTGQDRDKLVLPSGGKTYYYLWTLERMAVIYGFSTIGDKDWYKWGTELLLANQHKDGSWQGEFPFGGADTCFALLFLKKANVAVDLTAKVGYQVKDPGKVPAKLLDLIGTEVKPGVDMKKDGPKKNDPEPQPGPEPREEETLWLPAPAPLLQQPLLATGPSPLAPPGCRQAH